MAKKTAIAFIEIAGQTIPAGRLTVVDDGRMSRSEFQYGRRYLERPNAVAIDPVMLPLTQDKFYTPEDFALFNGIRDASPDAFGRAVIDNYMLRHQNRPADESDFLFASQSGSRIGALRFGPTPDGPGQVLDHAIPSYELGLGDLATFKEMVDNHMDDGALPERFSYLVSGGSDAGGARPKATVTVDGFPWLAKFGKESDRVQNAASEAACLDLCEIAGLRVPDRKIVNIADRPTLLVERFDRYVGEEGDIQRKHMISSMTILGAHERDAGMSGYADICDGMRRFSGDERIGEEIYKRMVMNVLCGNTDDHYRNHAFLMDDDQKYRISPVYDVTPTLQATGTRHLFLHLGRAGSGREATLEAAVNGSESLGLHRDQAISIANDLAAMVEANWESSLRARGAPQRDIEMLAGAFGESAKRIEVDEPDDEYDYRM
ncbi:MAG: HipA domain-containing protein [Roseibium sp.]|uniref:type II toxin-antitoxin system HipA family toxin n=1 Tax=Roseibium sp. TaxID=1936156 RepID=UPI003297DB90